MHLHAKEATLKLYAPFESELERTRCLKQVDYLKKEKLLAYYQLFTNSRAVSQLTCNEQ